MQILTAKKLTTTHNIAIIVSRFNEEITQKLQDGAIARLQELGVSEDKITIVCVPGAVEIPITAQRLARTKKFDVIVCLGAVIYGQTRHFDYVCDQVTQGCQKVALENNIPVIFGILTTDNIEQARDRVGGVKGHAGRSAIDTAMEMVSVLDQI